MLARLDPRCLDRLWFPLGERTKEETRARGRAAGLAAARRAESQEACFLAGGDYRDFLARHGLGREDGPVVDESGRSSAGTRASGASRPASAAGLGVATGSPCTRSRPTPRTNTVVVGPRESLARTTVGVRPAGSSCRSSGSKRSCATARRRARARRAAGRGFRLTLDRPAYGVAPARPPCSTRRTRSSAPV